jgi:hypothetical protein
VLARDFFLWDFPFSIRGERGSAQSFILVKNVAQQEMPNNHYARLMGKV